MAHFIIVRHQVREFTAWKKAYMNHLPKRAEAGLTEKHVLQGETNPNEVILMFEAADLARAKAFCESQDLKDEMRRCGVVDKPDIYFMNNG